MADWASIGGTALGSLIGGAFSMGASALNFEHQKKLMDKQNQFNLDMWKMQNEYNSPSAQMERFKAAGLNPYLIASQGNSGNAASAPQLGVPDAPDYSGAASYLEKAFNLNSLLSSVAARKKAQAEAKIAQTEAKKRQFEFQGQLQFNNNWIYDIKSGRYLWAPLDGNANVTDRTAERYYMATHLPQTYLPQYRANLIESQRSYLSPQIWMANYEKEHYPITYWIGQGGKVAKGLGDVVSVFTPFSKFQKFKPLKRGYVAPSGKVYNY